MSYRIVAVLLAQTSIFICSFLIFVTYNDYPVTRPEILICIVALSAVGMLLGLLGRLARILGAGALSSALLFFIDVQVKPPIMLLALTGFALLVLCWLVRDNLAIVCSAMFATMAVSTLLFGGRSPEPYPAAIDGRSPIPQLPVYVHILLDEHIGVEGLPHEIEGSDEVRKYLKSFFADNGFYLFGQAFSPFFSTNLSVSHFVNYASAYQSGLAVQTPSSRFAYQMVRNRYFADMREAGYRITVYQPDYIDFCSSKDIVVEQCHTYSATSIQSIRDIDLSVSDKARITASMYLSRSRIYREVRKQYNRLAMHSSGWPLPAWTWDRDRVGPIPVMRVLDRLEADLADARPGDFFFAHLLVPHYPYVYDAHCKIRTQVAKWLNVDAPEHGARNTIASREERYRRYFSQIACASTRLQKLFERLKKSGQYDQAVILIHGDHGSRITLSPISAAYRDRLTVADLRDAFSTLFAFKAPGIQPGYDQNLWPIGQLLAALRLAGFRAVPAFANDAVLANVHLRVSGLPVIGGDNFVKVPMPGFAPQAAPEISGAGQ